MMTEPERRTQESDFIMDMKPAHYYTEELLVPLSTWRHEKTGGTYTVLGVSTYAGLSAAEYVDRMVIYASHTNQRLCHLGLSEFLDGRFCPEPRGE